MATRQPVTYDAFVELATADPAVVGLVVVTLTGFREGDTPDGEHYALARARVVLDRADGGIARILADKALSIGAPAPATRLSRPVQRFLPLRPVTTRTTWSSREVSAVRTREATSGAFGAV